MAKVSCSDCIHYKEAPYQALRTGCWLPDNMPQKHSEAYLDQQQIPGDHEKINLRGDCADFSALPDRGPLWKRIWTSLSGRSDAAQLGRAPIQPSGS